VGKNICFVINYAEGARKNHVKFLNKHDTKQIIKIINTGILCITHGNNEQGGQAHPVPVSLLYAHFGENGRISEKTAAFMGRAAAFYFLLKTVAFC